MKFKLIPQTWSKRRAPTQKPDYQQITVEHFHYEHNAQCVVHAYINDVEIQLKGRILHNKIKNTWSINSLNSQGHSINLQVIK